MYHYDVFCGNFWVVRSSFRHDSEVCVTLVCSFDIRESVVLVVVPDCDRFYFSPFLRIRGSHYLIPACSRFRGVGKPN